MESILIHSCCAHCAAYTAGYWREQGYEVSALWYNPNIHPYAEHQHRLAAMKALAEEISLPLIVTEGYDVIEYFRRVAGREEEPARCRLCFRLRLTKAAEIAGEMGFSGFTTTLLISPHQKHDIIKEVGEEVAEETGIAFRYADLRKRYSDSRHITKGMNLYRQQYCGCLYSEWEAAKPVPE
jgi:predicted adenine nucleotide alpha hydrolase (AANH) superfamily ATPase